MNNRNSYPNRPNILFILSDDLGYWSLGCEGNSEAITPNIDSIAEQGVRLSQFFCTSPVCSPARASLFTGRMPSDHGVVDWLRKGSMNEEGDSPVQYLRGFKGFPEYLQEAGYRCGISGKWHLGDSQTPQMGFEHWYVHQQGGGPYFGAPMIRDGSPVTEDGYVTEAITNDALAFLRDQQREERPFFLYVSYTAPHTPWINNHPQRYLDMYRDCPFLSCPIEPRHPWQIDFPLFEGDRRENLKGYFASITAMDEGIGQLLDELKKQNLLENTLVLFTSDNGFNCGHHGVWGKGNGTYPFNMYDTSVRVPFVAMMPGTLPQGKTIDSLVSAYDWFQTILAFAGVPCEEEELPGHSFLPLLLGHEEESAASDDAVYIYDEYGDARMIRTREWKYVCRYPNGPDELYDLQRDPEERVNCLDSNGACAAVLKEQLTRWFEQYSRPEHDARGANVRGWGQDKPAGSTGFPKDAFCQS